MNRNLLLLGSIMMIFFSCDSKQEKKELTLASIKDTKVLQYAIEGKNLYDTYCANCHQHDGTGLAKLIPPLKNSDYLAEDMARTARIIKYGQQGEITVNGIIYNQPMPANPTLTNLEIARIMSYLYNIWGNSEGVIDANKVAEFLEQKD